MPEHDRLPHTAEQTMMTYRMIQSGDSVLVAVSGGPDSVALLHVLLAVAPKHSLKIGVAHVNHCLRGEDSHRDEEFVRSLAERIGRPYHMIREDVQKYRQIHKLSLEEAGRQVRYAFYDKVAKAEGFDKIALGHHADDNAEHVLMALFRGSGPLGISGIPPVREGKFIRPLIRVTKSEIVHFLARNRLTYVSDVTNTDTRHLRNRIRHQLIPMLKTAYNPGITETLNRLSLILRDEEEWIEELIGPIFKSCVRRGQGRTQNPEPGTQNPKRAITLSVSAMNDIHPAARRRIIRKAIHHVKGDLRRITYAHTDAIMHLSKADSGCGRLELPDGVRVERKEEGLLFAIRDVCKLQIPNPYEYQIAGTGTIFIREIGMHLRISKEATGNGQRATGSGQQTTGNGQRATGNGQRATGNGQRATGNGQQATDNRRQTQTVGHFDMDALDFPMTIRNFRLGDRFTPLGMAGTQKLKKYFINNKVSKEERARCPILLSRGKIVWIAGHRMDDSAKITPLTKNVLKAELFLA